MKKRKQCIGGEKYLAFVGAFVGAARQKKDGKKNTNWKEGKKISRISANRRRSRRKMGNDFLVFR